MKESKHEVLRAALQSGAPSLKFDPREYSHFLADTGWTEAQKDEFTEALWGIVVGFVDMGFSMNPVQQAMSESALVPGSGCMLDSPDISTIKEDRVAAQTTPAVREMDS